MKRFLFLISILLTAISLCTAQYVNPNYHSVKGYHRKDGTYVRPHKRTNPNSTNRDNYSTRGNVNIWTGEPGWIEPDNKPLPSYSKPSLPSYTPSFSGENRSISRTDNYSSNYTYNYNYVNSSPGEKAIYYRNGKETFNVTSSKRSKFSKSLTYYSYDPYKQELLETKGGAKGMLLDGEYRFYNSEGQLIRKEHYDRGVKHGLSILYDDDGSEKEAIRYDDGVITYARFKNDQGHTVEWLNGIMEAGSTRMIYNGHKLLEEVNYLSRNKVKTLIYSKTTGKLQYEMITDPVSENGKITEYYYDGKSVKSKGKLIDGKLNGEFKEFNMYGTLVSSKIFKKGVENGPFKIFYDDGKLRQSGNLLNGKLQGEVKEFDEEGSLESKVFYRLGKLDGPFTHYQDGAIAIKGQFSGGEEHGRWDYYYSNSEEPPYIVQYFNYSHGKLDGAFREIRSDSVLVGTYENDLLHGQFEVYRSLSAMFLGYHVKSLNEKEIITTGEYYKGKKAGYWKNYNVGKFLESEGRYINDAKEGEWKYYYNSFVDIDGTPLKYSKELFLIENYVRGKKHGKSLRYSYLSKERIMCDTSIGTVNPLDTCYDFVYRKITELAYYKEGVPHGPYEQKDSLGQQLFSGNFINGKKEGAWTEVLQEDEEKFTYERLYRAGGLNGSFKKFNSEGVLLANGVYDNGHPTGVWYEYFPDGSGRLYTKTTYKDDEWTQQVFNVDQRLAKEFFCKGNKVQSIMVTDTVNYEPAAILKIQSVSAPFYYISITQERRDTIFRFEQKWNTKLNEWTADPGLLLLLYGLDYTNNPEDIQSHGRYTVFSKNGNLLEEGQFESDRKAGDWFEYHYNQGILRKKVFKEGKEYSESFFQLASKNKPYSGKFRLNKSDGTTEIIKVKKGQRHGVTKIIDQSGKIIKRLKFSDGISVN